MIYYFSKPFCTEFLGILKITKLMKNINNNVILFRTEQLLKADLDNAIDCSKEKIDWSQKISSRALHI